MLTINSHTDNPLTNGIIPAIIGSMGLVIAASFSSHATATSHTKQTDIWQPESQAYWYQGEAEISSYTLQQARYGELHPGHAVLVYVTEPMRAKTQVKADSPAPSNIPVLKLNSMKTFTTGIYPYSLMTSTFYPVESASHALKITASAQEWCGHVFTQLNRGDDYHLQGFSYFESEGDTDQHLAISHTENELWTKLRINPKWLPTGDIDIIPSFDFLRLRHHTVKAYSAQATLSYGDQQASYTLHYPSLNRRLSINFNSHFPYEINGWEETYLSGFGANAKPMTTTATRLTTIKSDYWNKNSLNDRHWRQTLKLEATE